MNDENGGTSIPNSLLRHVDPSQQHLVPEFVSVVAQRTFEEVTGARRKFGQAQTMKPTVTTTRRRPNRRGPRIGAHLLHTNATILGSFVPCLAIAIVDVLMAVGGERAVKFRQATIGCGAHNVERVSTFFHTAPNVGVFLLAVGAVLMMVNAK
jgi:hypothetical protein